MDAFGFMQESQICLAFWVPWLSFWALGHFAYGTMDRTV